MLIMSMSNIITVLLDIPNNGGQGTYLGLPYFIGRSKKVTFQFVEDRMWKNFNGWKDKVLSQVEKEVLNNLERIF